MRKPNEKQDTGCGGLSLVAHDGLETAEDFAGLMAERRGAAVLRFQQVAKALAAEAEVKKVVYHDRGLCGRAFVRHRGERVASIHVPRPTTRRRLYVFAHECGHVALDHDGSKPTHRQEFEAERWATGALRSHGIAVPRKELERAKEYVARKIDMAVRRRAKRIDRESYRYCEDHVSFEVKQWLAEGGKLGNLSGLKAAVN